MDVRYIRSLPTPLRAHAIQSSLSPVKSIFPVSMTPAEMMILLRNVPICSSHWYLMSKRRLRFSVLVVLIELGYDQLYLYLEEICLKCPP